MDRQRLGDPVLASEGFHPGLHDRARLHGEIKPEFDRRNVKIVGLSVDSTGDHDAWARDIEETQGHAPNYPIIGDADFNVSMLYGMLPASTSGDPKTRTPADNQTVRNVFVIGPDKKVKLILVYPMTTGRNFDEVLRVVLQTDNEPWVRNGYISAGTRGHARHDAKARVPGKQRRAWNATDQHSLTRRTPEAWKRPVRRLSWLNRSSRTQPRSLEKISAQDSA